MRLKRREIEMDRKAIHQPRSRTGPWIAVLFEHSGVDVSAQWRDEAFRGDEFGWRTMLEKLPAVVADLAGRSER
jgi:hypothetical protein